MQPTIRLASIWFRLKSNIPIACAGRMSNVSKCFTNLLLYHLEHWVLVQPCLVQTEKTNIQSNSLRPSSGKWKSTEYQSKTVSHVKYLAKSRTIIVFFEMTPWNSKVEQILITNKVHQASWKRKEREAQEKKVLLKEGRQKIWESKMMRKEGDSSARKEC